MRETRNRQMTELDILGEKFAAKEKIEEKLGIRRTQRVPRSISALESLEDLLKRDREREQDGFPSKIKFRRVLVGPGKVITVPYVEEEKLIHGEFVGENLQARAISPSDEEENEDIKETIGSGEGEVGDVIGQVPIYGRGEGEGEEPQAGDEPGEHGFEEELYETGKKLIEQFQLPNLKEKPKKVPTDEYIYDLTDRHEGSGQVLDEEETLTRIVETNLVLGRVRKDRLDTKKMVVSPDDMIYRVLSKERLWKTQAVAVFMRDYSGSMWGEPTRVLVNQHLMIYAWLLVQYENLVIPRFIVHDTAAREVTVKQYFGLESGGGTFIASGYKKINEIVEGEGLQDNYNIYVFQGTDGEDFDSQGGEALPEIQKILQYVNRMGVTVFQHPYYGNRKTPFEEYLEKGNILQRRDVFRMHVMSSSGVTEDRNIEAVKTLIAQE